MSWVRRTCNWLISAVRGVMYLVFAAVCCAGLHHAWTAERSQADPDAELRRLKAQLVEATMRGQELSARVEAFDKRPEVRLQMIRTELGMLRPDERVYVLK
ncbi:MAG: septum formation initiator family protein [Deltaproteobacteria bacterium]|nr:septum formation initiator family protein [Deltaproteobacteria bacterium]